ncbi:hypothetical protein JCM24511_01512 [Saitozyma sp. JCM 24511]|nr:hypothetical protein JCM24511_01512 [Saitozyma sp. JCM 24511]
MLGVQEADSDRLESKSRQSLIQQAIARQHSGVGSGHPSTRAGTIKMSTRASTIAEGLRDYVVAVIQGKGAGVEVGIAAISLTTGKIADDNNFHRTVHHLTSYAPETILVPETLLMNAMHNLKEGKGGTSRDLVQVLEDEFGVHCEPLVRALWKREAGLEFIQTLGAEDPLKASTVMQAADKYYALCASAALLKWVQTRRNIIFTPNSLRISYTTLEGVMFIDPETARNLELVANSSTHKSTNTLFELMQAGEGLNVVRDALEPLQKLCQQTATLAKFQLTEHRITLLLRLKTLIKTLPALASSLKQCKSSLLQRLQETLGNPDVLDITRLIEGIINEDTSSRKSGRGYISRNAKLWAIKAHCNNFLDVARSTCKENEEDIEEYTHGLDCFTEWTEKGYRLVAAGEGVELNLPPFAINVERTKSKVKFTTNELQRKNSRLQQAQEEVFSLSQDTVTALLSQVLKHIKKACSRSATWIETLLLTSGLPGPSSEIQWPYAADGSSIFQLIQGPNMSGKSTYLRQIGLLTVQATLGCFVPAESAHLKLHDALLSRLSNDDSMEKSLSTFASEMATSAMIMGKWKTSSSC